MQIAQTNKDTTVPCTFKQDTAHTLADEVPGGAMGPQGVGHFPPGWLGFVWGEEYFLGPASKALGLRNGHFLPGSAGGQDPKPTLGGGGGAGAAHGQAPQSTRHLSPYF